MAAQQWFFRRGELARGSFQVVVDETIDGWQHTGLHVAELTGAAAELTDTGVERIVVPLAGRFRVTCRGPAGERTIDLAGRASVFDGPTDVAYVPTGSAVTIEGAGRVAIASARTDTAVPPRHLEAHETPVELRGAGRCSRQVHNFGTPQALPAARLIVCEVITPAGNVSSYPPHKHDTATVGRESRLEEIYYFEIEREHPAPTGSDEDAAGMFATYSSAAGEIDVAALVHTGDISLVPYGYHGPAAALPGCDMYYLNVMAGPDAERQWLITDDPGFAWVRGTWADQPVDPRLPYPAGRKEQV